MRRRSSDRRGDAKEDGGVGEREAGRGERRGDALPGKQRGRLDVCCLEGMLRKQARSRGRIPHNTLPHLHERRERRNCE